MVITTENWNAVRRPGMTLELKLGPAPPRYFGRIPNVVTGRRAPTIKGEVYQEVNKLLKLSRSWTPDAESLKGSGIGHLLRLWTNAIDPDNGDDSDDSSIRSWSSSGSSDIVD